MIDLITRQWLGKLPGHNTTNANNNNTIMTDTTDIFDPLKNSQSQVNEAYKKHKSVQVKQGDLDLIQSNINSIQMILNKHIKHNPYK